MGSHVRERLWFAAAPQGPGPEPGDGALPRSAMQLRINTTDSAKGGEYVIDLGQSIELVAESLSVELWAPQGSAEVTDEAPPPQQGLLFDARCMVRMLRLETSRGLHQAHLTRTVVVPTGVAWTVEVPNAARRLTVYPNLALPVPQTLRWLRGDPSTATIDLGEIGWDGDRPRTEIDVPSATHLRIEASAGQRVFTLVWTITP